MSPPKWKEGEVGTKYPIDEWDPLDTLDPVPPLERPEGTGVDTFFPVYEPFRRGFTH